MTNEEMSKLTVSALRKLAAERNIKGRSTMTKPALIDALSAIDVDKGGDTGAPIGIINDPAIDVVVDTNLYATSIGNADHFRDVATMLDRMKANIESFRARAISRYLKGGQKRLTPKQARRVAHKTNAYMQKAGW